MCIIAGPAEISKTMVVIRLVIFVTIEMPEILAVSALKDR
jgi:hypothetical protein